MKVTILSGGTGSKGLQSGFHKIYGDTVIPRILINAYDNGLSTGAVRKVMDGNILGPSDLRKNQEHQAALHDTMPVGVKRFLALRINATSAADMKEQILSLIDSKLYYAKLESVRKYLKTTVDAFFSSPNADLIAYDDFSIANIFYAGAAKMNNYSLAAAGEEIAKEVLNIPEDRVMLVSDDSLFLQAITESGKLILDEGDIVKWSNPNDRISDIKLVNSKNKEVVPELTDEVIATLLDSDVIIFSSGTQWSSLIPTYIHKDFRETIEMSKAKKYLVMNNVPDEDMIGLDSNDVLAILSSYLPLDQISVVFNNNADESMRNLGFMKGGVGNYIDGEFSKPDSKVHDHRVVAAIMKDALNGKVESSTYMFDFDDTLVDKKDIYKDVNSHNLQYLQVNPDFVVVSGNSLNHINSKLAGRGKFENNFYVDGGNSLCKWSTNLNRLVFEEYVDSKFVYSQEEVNEIFDILLENEVPIWKIENRNYNIISIKPLEENQRKEIYTKLKDSLGDEYEPKMLGKTTIDIFKKGYDKTVVLDHYKGKQITYLGDETESGNDAVFRGVAGIECHQVDSPIETLAFLQLLDTNDQ